MQPIIYDVAVSVDGYISGPDGDISKFASNGQVVDNYVERLSTYACAIMGRATYEFGYRYGLEPGCNPYPTMQTYVFSEKIDLPDDKEVTVIRDEPTDALLSLRTNQNGPIYLCGGGKFAGALLSSGQIDIVRLKRAPIILGGGTKLFAGIEHTRAMTHVKTMQYDAGYLFQELSVIND